MEALLLMRSRLTGGAIDTYIVVHESTQQQHQQHLPLRSRAKKEQGMIELQVGFITSLRPHFSILFSSIVHQNGRIKSIFFDAPATATNAELSWLSLTAV